jgi:hypothetical protein
MNIPTIQDKALLDPARQQRFSYKHITPSLTEGALPPPDPNNYYSIANRRYLDPTRPYLEDLKEYRNYIQRYVFRLSVAVSASGILRGVEAVGPPEMELCKDVLSSIKLPPIPKEPNLESLANFQQLSDAYYVYSEALYRHLNAVTEIYDRALEAHNEKCTR